MYKGIITLFEMIFVGKKLRILELTYILNLLHLHKAGLPSQITTTF